MLNLRKEIPWRYSTLQALCCILAFCPALSPVNQPEEQSSDGGYRVLATTSIVVKRIAGRMEWKTGAYLEGVTSRGKFGGVVLWNTFCRIPAAK